MTKTTNNKAIWNAYFGETLPSSIRRAAGDDLGDFVADHVEATEERRREMDLDAPAWTRTTVIASLVRTVTLVSL